MANNEYRKPSAEEFRRAVRELGGNLTRVADLFGVSRCTLYKWRDEDPEFYSVIKDERARLFDESLATSRIVAMGIPKYDYEYDADGEVAVDAAGRPVKKMVGWNVPPDGNMLRYFMSLYGKYDKIGFTDEEQDDVPAVQNGVSIKDWIELRNKSK